MLIISLPTLVASEKRGAKYAWIFSKRSWYEEKSPNETQSDQPCSNQQEEYISQRVHACEVWSATTNSRPYLYQKHSMANGKHQIGAASAARQERDER